MEEQFRKIRTEDPEVGEKHIPIVKVEEKDEGVVVEIKVGEVEHPSEPGHFIQWIEVLDGEISLERVYLSPFAKPKINFILKEIPENMKVRIFCNLHGTWEYNKQK